MQSQTFGKAATLDDSPFGINLSFEKIGEMPESITSKFKPTSAGYKSLPENLFGNGRKRQLSIASNHSGSSLFSGTSSVLDNIRIHKFAGSNNSNTNNNSRSGYSKSKGLFSTTSNLLTSLAPQQSNDDDFGQVLLEKYSRKSFDYKQPASDDPNAKSKDIQYKFNDIKKLVIDPEVSAAKRRKLLVVSKNLPKVSKKTTGNLEKDVTLLLSSTINNTQMFEQINFNNISKDKLLNEEERESIDFEKTPKGYWCSPSILKLSKMTQSELKSVSNFVIGRKNYGQICFDKNVDLSQFAESDPKLSKKMNLYNNLLTEKEIIFHPKKVEVYPNSENKPPYGHGINVEAIITLEDMFPKNIIKGQTFNVGDYITKLKKQPEMQFINYIAESGSWSFKVEHFSIWGLIDDSDEEDDELNKQPSKPVITNKQIQYQQTSPEKVKDQNETLNRNQPTVWGITDNMEIDPDDIIQENTSLNIRKNEESKHPDYPQEVVVYKDENEDHEMTGLNDTGSINDEVIEKLENSLLELEMPNNQQVQIYPSDNDNDEELALVHEKVYEPEKLTDNDFKTLEKQPNPSILENVIDVERNQNWDDIFSEISNPKNPSYSVFNPELQKCLALSNSLKKKDIKKLLSKKPIKEEKLSFNELDNILFGDVNRMIQNNNNALKELRVPGKNMIFSKFCIFNESGALYTNTKNSSFGYISLDRKFESFEAKNTLQGIFDEHYRLSSFEKRNTNKLPIVNASPSQEFSFLAKLFDTHRNPHHAFFWDLSSILFDDYRILENKEYMDINNDANDEIQKLKMLDIARNELLSKWLLSSNDQQIQPDSKDSDDDDEKVLKKVFYHLCRAEVNEAAEICITTKFNHLAVVISLLGSNDMNVKNGALYQLQYWKEKFSYSGMISPYILKIYKLLAGDFLDASDDEINVLEGLSWKTVYLLVLQYGDLNSSLVDLTCEFFSKFIDVNSSFKNPGIELSILKLYCLIYKDNGDNGFDFEAARKSFMTCSGSSYPLDVLNQWYVYHILLSRLPIVGEEIMAQRQKLYDFADKLSLQFAEQLLILNKWEFALFILIHLKNDELAKRYIEDLIFHKIDKITENDDGSSFCERFNIPRSFVASGIALKFNYDGEYLGEAYALIEAEKYDEAHKIIVQKVAPRCVIGDGILMDELMNLVELFPKNFKDESGSKFLLKDWSKSVGTYRTYALLKTLAELKELNESYSESELEVIESLINNLFVHLPMVELDNNKEIKIAVNLMSKFIVEFIFGGAILCDKFTKKAEVEKLLRLPLDESEKRYIQQYYKL